MDIIREDIFRKCGINRLISYFFWKIFAFDDDRIFLEMMISLLMLRVSFRIKYSVNFILSSAHQTFLIAINGAEYLTPYVN